MNKWGIILGTLSAILLGGLLGGSSASAASPYDDVITIPDEIILTDNGVYEKDFTDNIVAQTVETLYSVCTGSGWSHNPAACTIMDNTEYTSLVYDRVNKVVYGYYALSHTAYSEFSEVVPGIGQLIAYGDTATIYRVVFQYVENPVNINVSSEGLAALTIQNSSNYQITVQDGNTDMLFSQFPITYPSGYDGIEIPETYTPQLPLDWVPDFYALQGIDYKVTIQDKSFNTFDEVPFTCNEGLAPIIRYEIRDSSNEIVVIGQFSATVQLEQQLPKNNVESTYTILGNYDCGYSIDPTQPDFSGQASKEFTITAGGMLENEVFTSCFTDTPPFVDFENCLNNMADTLGMLSFGSIKFNNNWQFNSNCRELAVLGSWLNLEGNAKVICPQFPEYIRNVVTPFVTLLLGLVTLKFITSRQGSGI